MATVKKLVIEVNQTRDKVKQGIEGKFPYVQVDEIKGGSIVTIEGGPLNPAEVIGAFHREYGANNVIWRE